MSNVTHPSHYNSGKIEVIEAIEDWNLGFHLGNAVKYTARAGKKDASKTIEDLEKAIWYLKRHVENLRAKAENREPTRPNDMNPRRSASAPSAPFEQGALEGAFIGTETLGAGVLPCADSALPIGSLPRFCYEVGKNGRT